MGGDERGSKNRRRGRSKSISDDDREQRKKRSSRHRRPSSSDDDRQRRKKRSSRDISDEEIAEYMAKKAQKKAMKVAKKLKTVSFGLFQRFKSLWGF